MKQRMTTVRLLLTVVLIALTGISLSANGLNLNGQGSKAIAMGGAFIGQADDYSAIFWNPAGLTQIKKSSLSLFITDLLPTGTYVFPTYGIDAQTKADETKNPLIFSPGPLGGIPQFAELTVLSHDH